MSSKVGQLASTNNCINEQLDKNNVEHVYFRAYRRCSARACACTSMYMYGTYTRINNNTTSSHTSFRWRARMAKIDFVIVSLTVLLLSLQTYAVPVSKYISSYKKLLTKDFQCKSKLS